MLVAVSIPIFTSQLEKAREATDLANIRAAYAEVMVEAVTEPNGTYIKTVELKQAQDNWTTSDAQSTLNGLVDTVTDAPSSTNKYAVVKYTKPAATDNNGETTITFTTAKTTAATGETLLDR